MKHFLQVLIAVTIVAFGAGPATAASTEPDTAQVSALRVMQGLLKTGKYAEFSREWCHPHLQQQLPGGSSEWLKSANGKAVVRLYADVIRAIDAKAGPDTLIARPQTRPDQYEFILVAIRNQSPAARTGAQWHLELQLHQGRWKLMDTD